MESESWSSIKCKQTDLCLDIVLQCGQAFAWRQSEDGIWFGTLKDRVFLLKQSDSDLRYKVLPETGSYSDSEELLNDYFRLRENMSDCYKKWSEGDKVFRDTHQKISGIRILRQDPVENLFSFICSSANQTRRIAQLVLKLGEHFGKEIARFRNVPCYSFPRIEDLSEKSVHGKLTSLGFGYRSRYIQETANKLREFYSRDWLCSLRESSYSEAVASLIKFPGVGLKVADCVCLMSLDKLEAVPLDTHAIQIANRDYGLKLNSKSISKADHAKNGKYFRDLFGPKAGWAHTILFIADLKVIQKQFFDSSSRKRKLKSANSTHKKSKLDNQL